MPSLASSASRFEIPLTIIENGSGIIHGVVAETNQSTSDSRVFSEPRRVLRVRHPSMAKAGMVIRSPLGEVFIVANHGGSETSSGVIWESFKLFRATQQMMWKRRTTINDPVTTLEIESEPQEMGLIWVALEPSIREAIERKMHLTLEEAVFITGARVQRDDILDGRPVIRSEDELGLRVGTIR